MYRQTTTTTTQTKKYCKNKSLQERTPQNNTSSNKTKDKNQREKERECRVRGGLRTWEKRVLQHSNSSNRVKSFATHLRQAARTADDDLSLNSESFLVAYNCSERWRQRKTRESRGERRERVVRTCSCQWTSKSSFWGLFYYFILLFYYIYFI